MRLTEFASPADQLALWKLISDTVWSKLSAQSQQPVPPSAQARPRPTPRPSAKPALQRKSLSKPKKLKGRKVKIPAPPPPKPLPKPKPLYPAKPVAKPLTPANASGQTARFKANPAKVPAQKMNTAMATRGIAAMNAPAETSNLRNKPVQP